MEKKLRIGLIGAGFIGALHARIISENPCAELVAVADVSKEVCDAFAKEYGCDSFTDYNEMLKRDDIDAVDICVPEDYHLGPAVAAANAKKQIFIEKPIAKTVKEAKEIKEAADKNGVRIMVAHVLKFDPRYVQLNDAIKNGELGELTSLHLKRTNARSTPIRLKGKISFFYYLGVHDIEWMLDYNKAARPVKVYCQASSKVNKSINQLDTAFMIVTFDNGSVGNIELSWALPENPASGFMTSVEVIGDKGIGLIQIDNQGLEIITEDTVSYPDALHWPTYNGKIQGDLREEVDHFVESTLNNTPYVVSTDNAIDAIAVIEAAMKSIDSGKAEDVF